MPIMNDVELNQIVLNDLKDIIDEVTIWLNEKLLDSMQDIVYNAGTPQSYDRRIYHGDGLFQSFEKKDAMISGQEINSEITHKPELMHNDPDIYAHGSHFWPTTDVREWIAQMIIEGSSGPLFGDRGFWLLPRDFWSPMEELLKNGSVDREIEKAFTSRGIIWKKF